MLQRNVREATAYGICIIFQQFPSFFLISFVVIAASVLSSTPIPSLLCTCTTAAQPASQSSQSVPIASNYLLLYPSMYSIRSWLAGSIFVGLMKTWSLSLSFSLWLTGPIWAKFRSRWSWNKSCRTGIGPFWQPGDERTKKEVRKDDKSNGKGRRIHSPSLSSFLS